MMKEYNQIGNENTTTKVKWKFLGTICAIPRIKLFSINSSSPFTFGRRQFPMTHSYVMIINKSHPKH